MPHVVAAFDAEGDAAEDVAAQPATQDARAPLRARHFQTSPCIALLPAARALHRHRTPLVVDAGHAFVFSQFLGLEELGELLLALRTHDLAGRGLALRTRLVAILD